MDAPLLFRWDLDKTYLRTEFDTFRDLLRTAVEAPGRKESLPGATRLVRTLTESAPLHILSGSPEQMRSALETKLKIDGLRWESLTLKPSFKRILKGQLRYVRDQLAYKLIALLRSRVDIGPGADEVLFGDDAEADAFVYSLYADVLADRVPLDTLKELFSQAKVYEEDQRSLLDLIARVPKRDAVRRIYINLDRMSSPQMFADFGARVFPTFNYFQTALVLIEDRMIDVHAALAVGAEYVAHPSTSPDALMASYADVAQRGGIGADTFHAICATKDEVVPERYGRATPEIRAFIDHLALRTAPQLSEKQRVLPTDYCAIHARDRLRARAAKRRATRRG